MRAGFLTALAFASALVGGSIVYALNELSGDERTPARVVVNQVEERPAPSTAAVRIPRDRFDPAAVYAARADGVVTVYSFFAPSADAHAALGSGFVVSPGGYILTSAHVITTAGTDAPFSAARRVYVGFSDGDRVAARVVGWDLYDDVGVLRVDPGDHALQPLPLGDPGSLRVGEPVAAIGSPFERAGSLAVGVVSALGRSIPSLTSDFDVVDAIQTDAPITHGNSGGPLLDERGRVVGINAQIQTESGETEGVGFAVPIDAARRSLAQLLAAGRVTYPYVGIATDDLIPGLARRLRYPVSRGAMITDVTPGSPAAAAGLRAGAERRLFNGAPYRPGADVVVAIGGRPVRGAEDIARVLIARHRPGQTVTFTVVREGRRRDVPVHLGARSPAPDAGH